MTGLSPAPAQGPAFGAYIGAAQTILASTLTLLNFDTERFDTDGNYDTVAMRFTPKKTGKYQVNFLMNWDALEITKTFYINLRKNGTEFIRQQIATAVTTTIDQGSPLTAIVDMNGSTDYIEAWAWHNAATSKDVRAGSFFSHFSACWLRG